MTQTIDYPSLPAHLQHLADSTSSMPDFGDASNLPEDLRDLDSLPDSVLNVGETINKQSENNIKYQDLSWNSSTKKELLMDYDFVRSATLRRAALGFGKGFGIGGGLGGILSFYLIRRSKTRLPNSLHVYTMGCTGFVFGCVKMVQDTRRYQEYVAYVQSGITNPDQLHIEDAKEHLGTLMEKTMNPQAVKKMQQTPQMQRMLEKQLSSK